MSRAVRIIGHLTGLSKGFHGLHIHQYSATNIWCSGIGGHYNPYGSGRHGGRNDVSSSRHLGDLGNVYVASDGHAHINMTDLYVNLYGGYSVVNRTLVITRDSDDLGTKGDITSLTNGNAGPPLACGIITLTNVVTATDTFG